MSSHISQSPFLLPSQASLLDFQDRDDAAEYTAVLKEVLALFWEGIHEPLTRTMGKYLEATDGAKSKSKLSTWKLEDAEYLIAHNNAAERPFAIVKGLMKMFPSLKLSHAAAIASAKVNGTFDEDGDANLSDPRLQSVCNSLCGIRKAKPGAVTLMHRGFLSVDLASCKAHRTGHRKNQEKANMEIAKGRVLKTNTAQQVVLHRTPEAMQASLDSFGDVQGHVWAKS